MGAGQSTSKETTVQGQVARTNNLSVRTPMTVQGAPVQGAPIPGQNGGRRRRRNTKRRNARRKSVRR